ncbi:DgyrCDS8780 [Dimorphilus gyrociliatus]|uniref:DgyrCDS8780 n=1 Tax=Dimorphilus gyrociliatus TaxID=2664684 RepID=A0A7I8VW84_9ANNE|nr:DgyrCDS8780 [Dimorphilus gyrociliatus]
MAVNTIISNEAGESNVGASGKSSQLQALIDAEDSSLLSITSLILSSSIKLAEPIEECKIHISFKMIYMINLILIQVKSLLSYQNDLGVLVEIDDNPTPLCNPYESSLPSFNFNWLQLPCTGVGSSIRITNNQDKFSFEELEIYVTDSNNPNIYNVEYTDNTGPDLSSYINIAPKLMIVSHLKDRSHFVWTDQDITTCDNSWNLSENPSIIFCHVRKLKVFFIRFKVKEFGSVNFQVVGINGYSISLSENNFNRTYDIDLRNITWITDEIGVKETTKATVCEVEIYGNLLPYENVNLINNSNWKITSSNQLDSTLKNLTDEDWSTRVCSNVTAYFNSYYQTFPWISIDLDAVYNVSYIFVTLSRVTNLDVTLTDYEIPRNYSEYSLHQVRRVCKLNLEISWSNLITCVKETRGKFLIFTAKEQQSLQLCEVSVFGSIYNKDYSLSRLPMIEKPNSHFLTRDSIVELLCQFSVISIHVIAFETITEDYSIMAAINNTEEKYTQIFHYKHSDYGDHKNGTKNAFDLSEPFLCRFLWLKSSKDMNITIEIYGHLRHKSNNHSATLYNVLYISIKL